MNKPNILTQIYFILLGGGLFWLSMQGGWPHRLNSKDLYEAQKHI